MPCGLHSSLHSFFQLKVPLLVAEGPGPVEIVTALAEDVQKARQCKCRSASCAGHNPDA